MKQYDPRVDEYIGKTPAFAQPILKYIRELMHAASPHITENIKWGCPFFEYKGIIGNMAAFKQHCAVGIWNSANIKDEHGFIKVAGEKDSAGSFGRITSLADLPPDKILLGYIKQAVALNEDGNAKPIAPGRSATPKPKAEIATPDYFIAALQENQKANTAFQAFSPSCKREYLEWITEAKTEPTRQKRMETALEWIAEGKTRHWKYK
ncbi:YdeI/OmpD-associated family protein [Mucilaginibacter sp. UYCu711]|uniref:YdeI/OmpD-associated family protein n=1 Tax=Mucilaginibacter sp. UYCu711 TaxID=3156339 RepID=UPI003D24D824